MKVLFQFFGKILPKKAFKAGNIGLVKELIKLISEKSEVYR